MGQKINPISLRLQKTNRKYDSSWYSNYHYGELFLFDLKVRDYLQRILKQLKYPEGRALISHFSKGSKINLFAFNPTSSRQQRLGAFGLKGAVRIASHTLTRKQEGGRKLSPVLGKSFQHRNELKRPLKALSSKSKALSIHQELLLANQVRRVTCSEKGNSVLLGTTFKQNTNKTGNKWNPFLPYLALSWYGTNLGLSFGSATSGATSANQGGKRFLILDEKTLGAKQDGLLVPSKGIALHKVKLNDLGRKISFSVNDSLFLKPYLSGLAYCFANQVCTIPKQQAHNTRDPLSTTSKQVFNASNLLPYYYKLGSQSNKPSNKQSKTSKAVDSYFTSGTKCVPSDWQHNGSHLVPFFALKDTLNPSYLLKAKRLKDSCLALQASASLTSCVEQKQQVVSKTLSLWYQRAQGSTHPVLVSLGADKKTVPFLTKETSYKAVAKSNPYLGLQSKTCCATTTCEASREAISKASRQPPREAQNRLPVKQPVALLVRAKQVANQFAQQTKEEPLRATFEQKQQSFSCHRHENSLYRCHVEGVLDQQTGSSVKLVPFQVSTEKQSALFLAQEVVYFLEKRVSFRKIKDQILKELKSSKIIKGVRITCSGRVGGKSKKAQKAKTETFKQGETSLGVFSSKIDFAQKSALTSFGLIGVKVWICFY